MCIPILYRISQPCLFKHSFKIVWVWVLMYLWQFTLNILHLFSRCRGNSLVNGIKTMWRSEARRVVPCLRPCTSRRGVQGRSQGTTISVIFCRVYFMWWCIHDYLACIHIIIIMHACIIIFHVYRIILHVCIVCTSFSGVVRPSSGPLFVFLIWLLYIPLISINKLKTTE